MGGKLHLKLNIGERPIVNKYREGKMKRTLERELNSMWNCWKGNAWSQLCWLGINLAIFCWVNFLVWQANISLDCWKRAEGMWHLRVCYSPLSYVAVVTEGCSVPWGWVSTTITLRMLAFNGFNRPVLKHGPRSLTCLRVFGWKTLVHNESESWDPCRGEHRRPDLSF